MSKPKRGEYKHKKPSGCLTTIVIYMIAIFAITELHLSLYRQYVILDKIVILSLLIILHGYILKKLGIFALAGFLWRIAGQYIPALSKQATGAKNGYSSRVKKTFALDIGVATGIFAERGHRAAIRKRQRVTLNLPDCCQNIITLGGIGSGKTTRVINPLLLQLLEQDAGGLIFDIKGDFKNTVYNLAGRQGRSVLTIGAGAQAQGINLLTGLNPEVAAGFLKSAFYLSGSGKTDAFWIDTAAELCRNALTVLYYGGSYTLRDLYRYIFIAAARADYLQKAAPVDEKDRRRLSVALEGLEIFDNYDDKAYRLPLRKCLRRSSSRKWKMLSALPEMTRSWKTSLPVRFSLWICRFRCMALAQKPCTPLSNFAFSICCSNARRARNSTRTNLYFSCATSTRTSYRRQNPDCRILISGINPVRQSV